MKFFVVPFLCLLIASRVFSQSQENFKSAMMEMKTGAEVIYTSDAHSFTFEIISDHIKPTEQPSFVIVDKKSLQFVCIPSGAGAKIATTDEDKKVQLLGYMQYELDYLKKDLKIEYANLKYDWITNNGVISLLWYYDMPEQMAAKKNGVQKQINMSTLCFSHVLNLSVPFLKDDSFNDDKGLLLKVTATLKQNDFKMDFNEEYKRLHQ
jgi:hypothetical protein